MFKRMFSLRETDQVAAYIYDLTLSGSRIHFVGVFLLENSDLVFLFFVVKY